jgi:hypothetical protein
MIKDYLNEILDGSKTFDARSYPTNKRGVIALIDSRTMKIYGTIKLVGCRKISADEYCSWHTAGRFQNYVFEVPDRNANFYAYDFEEPRKLTKPIKVNVEKHTWVEIPKDIEVE